MKSGEGQTVHAEEFSKARFGLKGYEWVQNLTSEINQSEHPQFRLSEKFAQRDELYRQETEADNTAVRLMLAYLLDAESQGIYFAAKQQFFLIETLHSLGVYSLYRDLTVLGKRICPGGSLTRTEELMKCLALNREQYVKASSIFSDFHRPVLWRTSDAMFAILESRKNHSGLSPKERTFAMSVSEEEELQAKGQVQKLDLRRRYAQNYQRAFLHSILIDTQVKLAMYTCALGLEREIERKFFFEFEGMQAARNRMELAVQGKGLP